MRLDTLGMPETATPNGRTSNASLTEVMPKPLRRWRAAPRCSVPLTLSPKWAGFSLGGPRLDELFLGLWQSYLLNKSVPDSVVLSRKILTGQIGSFYGVRVLRSKMPLLWWW